MNNSYIDEANVSHSWRGFELRIDRVPFVRLVTGRLLEDILAGLGHPCCGRGLGRIDHIQWASWKTLSWAVRMAMGATVTSLPLTSSQARALSDSVATELDDPEGIYHPLDGIDEDGCEWSDGRFVAFHCPECDQRIPAATWPAEARERHIEACTSRG